MRWRVEKGDVLGWTLFYAHLLWKMKKTVPSLLDLMHDMHYKFEGGYAEKEVELFLEKNK